MNTAVTEQRIQRVLMPEFGVLCKAFVGNYTGPKRQPKVFYEKYSHYLKLNPKLTEKVMHRIENHYKKKYKTIPDRDWSTTKTQKASKEGQLNRAKWSRLRLKAFMVYGNYCACCGAKPSDAKLTVDHIKSRNDHPELEYDLRNLQILCDDCNNAKGSWTCVDFHDATQRLKGLIYYWNPELFGEMK